MATETINVGTVAGSANAVGAKAAAGTATDQRRGRYQRKQKAGKVIGVDSDLIGDP